MTASKWKIASNTSRVAVNYMLISIGDGRVNNESLKNLNIGISKRLHTQLMFSQSIFCVNFNFQYQFLEFYLKFHSWFFKEKQYLLHICKNATLCSLVSLQFYENCFNKYKLRLTFNLIKRLFLMTHEESHFRLIIENVSIIEQTQF